MKLRLRIFPASGLPKYYAISRRGQGDPVKPQARVPERIGLNGSGRYCHKCGGITFGLSDACGSCGRVNGLTW
jgi:hypothetical protein